MIILINVINNISIKLITSNIRIYLTCVLNCIKILSIREVKKC